MKILSEERGGGWITQRCQLEDGEPFPPPASRADYIVVVKKPNPVDSSDPWPLGDEDKIGRLAWPTTAYAEVPIHG